VIQIYQRKRKKTIGGSRKNIIRSPTAKRRKKKSPDARDGGHGKGQDEKKQIKKADTPSKEFTTKQPTNNLVKQMPPKKTNGPLLGMNIGEPRFDIR